MLEQDTGARGAKLSPEREKGSQGAVLRSNLITQFKNFLSFEPFLDSRLSGSGRALNGIRDALEQLSPGASKPYSFDSASDSLGSSLALIDTIADRHLLAHGRLFLTGRHQGRKSHQHFEYLFNPDELSVHRFDDGIEVRAGEMIRGVDSETMLRLGRGEFALIDAHECRKEGEGEFQEYMTSAAVSGDIRLRYLVDVMLRAGLNASSYADIFALDSALSFQIHRTHDDIFRRQLAVLRPQLAHHGAQLLLQPETKIGRLLTGRTPEKTRERNEKAILIFKAVLETSLEMFSRLDRDGQSDLSQVVFPLALAETFTVAESGLRERSLDTSCAAGIMFLQELKREGVNFLSDESARRLLESDPKSIQDLFQTLHTKNFLPDHERKKYLQNLS